MREAPRSRREKRAQCPKCSNESGRDGGRRRSEVFNYPITKPTARFHVSYGTFACTSTFTYIIRIFFNSTRSRIILLCRFTLMYVYVLSQRVITRHSRNVCLLTKGIRMAIDKHALCVILMIIQMLSFNLSFLR